MGTQTGLDPLEGIGHIPGYRGPCSWRLTTLHSEDSALKALFFGHFKAVTVMPLVHTPELPSDPRVIPASDPGGL